VTVLIDRILFETDFDLSKEQQLKLLTKYNGKTRTAALLIKATSDIPNRKSFSHYSFLNQFGTDTNGSSFGSKIRVFHLTFSFVQETLNLVET
jgi:hypothetical protein